MMMDMMIDMMMDMMIDMMMDMMITFDMMITSGSGCDIIDDTINSEQSIIINNIISLPL